MRPFRAAFACLLVIALMNPVAGQSQADLSISVFGSPSVISTGQNVTYTLAISNAGPATAANLWIADAVPRTTIFVQSTPAPTLVLPNQIAISMGSLSVGATTNISVVFQTTATGFITNYVYAFSDTADSLNTNNVAATINAVSDLFYNNLTAFAENLGVLITNNANSFSAYTNWAGTNFASEFELAASVAELNSKIANNANNDALVYSVLAEVITNNAAIDWQNISSVSNLFAETVFGSNSVLFESSLTNGVGLYGLITNFLGSSNYLTSGPFSSVYETVAAAAALSSLITNNAASELSSLSGLSNAFISAGFGGATGFTIASTNGIGLYGLLTNSIAVGAQTSAAIAANLDAVSNLLAQSGFGESTNIFNLATTSGVGLYGLLTNYLALMSNNIVSNVTSVYQNYASTFQTQMQAAMISNAILGNVSALYSTYAYINTNRLEDNEQTVSACANGVCNFSCQLIAYTPFLSFISQSWHTNFQNADSIRLAYSTSLVEWPGGETYVPGTSPFDLVASVGYVQNGVTNWAVARWNGSEIVLVNPNSKIISDDIGISIPAGGTFIVRTWCNRDVDNIYSMPDGTRGLISVRGAAFPVSAPYFRGGSSFLNNGNGVISVGSSVAGSNPFTNAPFNYLTSPSAIAGSANEAFYPCAILGHSRVSEQTNVVIIGDSIAKGSADEFDIRPDGGVGFIRSAVFGSFGFVQLTAGGEKYSHWLNDLGAPARGSFILGAGRIICELGSNDAANGTNLVSLQAEALAVWTRFAKAGGGRVWATTLTPRASSTDFFATTNNQIALTDYNFTTIRNGYNDWLRAGAPMIRGVATTGGAPGAVYAGQLGHPLAGYFDVGATCEPYANAGIWTVPSTNVYLGVATAATMSSYTDASARWDTTANYGLGQMAGLVLVDLTHKGAATILSNTTNTVTFWNGQTIPDMTAGDRVKIFAAATFDGVHPLPAQNVVMAAAIPPSALQ